MNILLYYPSNKRTIAMETLIISLRDYGYNIVLLTTCEKGDLHLELEKNKIQTYSNVINKNISLIYYMKQVFFLINFCRRHQINFLHSHLQHANIIAVFAQYFIKAKCVIFRHHCNFLIANNSSQNKTEILFDKIIHSLAKKIIVPSNGVKNEIELNETKFIGKYKVLPYIYDFSKYQTPDPMQVSKIKEQYPADLLLLFCSRFIDFKRPFVALEVVKILVEKGLNVKMLILDDGPLRDEMEKFIQNNKLSSFVYIIGFRKDYINFFQSCDILIHPSLTDASNSTVKEMALLNKCVIVCEKTGDFDEYIINGYNGYLVKKQNTIIEMTDIIVDLYNNKTKIAEIGKRLRNDVLLKFSNTKNIIELYIKETL